MATQVTWNLTELFRDIVDPKIEQAIKQAETGADIFEKKYRGKIGTLSPEELQLCFQEIEAFEAQFSGLTLF